MSNLSVPVNYQSPYDATSLITHLQKYSTPAACLYAVSPIDGTVVAMTSYSSNLTGVPGYPGVTFKRNTGVTASQLQSDAGNAFSQMEASVFLMATGITEADVLAGKWAHARAVLFVCNYEALNMGQLIKQYGSLAEFVQRSPIVTCEIKGLNNALTAQIGKVTRAECFHDFCDAGCTLDEADYTITGTLTGATSVTSFADSGIALPAGWLNNGRLVFTTPAVAATGRWTVSTNPSDGDTVVANGATFTMRNSPSGAYEIQIGGGSVATALNIANALNASSDPLVSVATYSRVGSQVRVVYDTAGTIGNSYTLAATGGHVVLTAGATLTGGTAPGSNNGYVLRIDNNNTATQIILRTPAPYLPVIGDTYSAVAGCQKRITDCKARVQNDGVTTENNVINFGGFPSIPTLESFSRLPSGLSV